MGYWRMTGWFFKLFCIYTFFFWMFRNCDFLVEPEVKPPSWSSSVLLARVLGTLKGKSVSMLYPAWKLCPQFKYPPSFVSPPPFLWRPAIRLLYDVFCSSHFHFVLFTPCNSALLSFVQAEQNLKEASSTSSSTATAPGEPEAEGGKPNKTQQLKKVFKEYGAVGVSFHIGISLMSLGMFYLLISRWPNIRL